MKTITNDITMNINRHELNNLLEVATKQELFYHVFEGSLIDNYIIYDTDNITIEGVTAKYIMIKESFLNEWSSEHVLILTNDIEKVEEFETLLNSFIEE